MSDESDSDNSVRVRVDPDEEHLGEAIETDPERNAGSDTVRYGRAQVDRADRDHCRPDRVARHRHVRHVASECPRVLHADTLDDRGVPTQTELVLRGTDPIPPQLLSAVAGVGLGLDLSASDVQGDGLVVVVR